MSLRIKKLIWFVLALLAVAGAIAYWLLSGSGESSELRLANEALNNRDFEQASLHLAKHLDKNPKDLPARLLAAQTARRRRAYYNAVEHLQAYERIGGRKEDVALEQSLSRAQQGNLREARQLLQKWTDRTGSVETPLVLEAALDGTLDVYLPQSAFRPQVSDDEAAPTPGELLRAADVWLQLRPSRADQVQGYIWRGRANRVADLHAQAISDFRTALELDPSHLQARAFLSLAISQESPQESRDHLRYLHERLPDDVQITYQLATVLRNLGRLQEAKKLLDGLLGRNPHLFSALLERGYIALDEQKPDEAEHWLRIAHAEAPNDAEANLALGRCLRIAGKSTEAAPYLKTFERIEEEMKRKQKTFRQKTESARSS